jgi:curli production assembly/transport component CsgG/holdfast attachment protein HfaB
MTRISSFTRSALCAALLSTVAACASSPEPAVGPTGLYARPIGSAPATSNATPYSRALFCIGEQARRTGRPSPVIAVGRITDYTGKQEEGMGGPKLTQGGSLMAISALAQAGADIVERFDTSVPEMELRFANNKLIGDAAGSPSGYRPIRQGQYLGSDYVLTGGITELNYNIRSTAAEVGVGGGDAKSGRLVIGGKSYVMNVGVDLRLVDTRTMRVVDVVSYQKQILGREVGGGGFSFLGSNVIDISAGSGELEPLQLGVRSLIERATVEFMGNLYGLSPDPCLAMVNDPLAT